MESNDDIAQAQSLATVDTGQAKITGRIASISDVDVFDLGSVKAGDRVVVRARATGTASLDPVVALLDSSEEMVNYNDDEDYGNNNFNSYVDHTVRRASTHLYVAITNSAYQPSTGSYQLTVQMTHGNTIPTPPSTPQAVLLDFNGATITIPGDQTYKIPAFDASKISTSLDGKEDTLIQEIKQEVEEHYEGYNIEFYTTEDAQLPAAGTYSTVAFGLSNTMAFGIAQEVDHYNQNPDDQAIVFTDNWTRPFSKGYNLSENQIVTSIGNVAAHELAHLLGLEHTADVKDLMDATGTADTILVPQIFKVAPLESDVFPFGTQDEPQLLLDTLGTAK